MSVAFIVPAYQAESTVGEVVTSLVRLAAQDALLGLPPVIVVDDGSTDETASRARTSGARVLRHSQNRGKGAALLTGLCCARDLGASFAVTVDADGQHPAEEAFTLARHPAPNGALVLGVRDLRRDGAPANSRFSNAFSNLWVSCFAGKKLADTQCGLRRYPLPKTLELGLRGTGFEFESEVLLKAVRAGFQVVQVPVRVKYPAPAERISHFHNVRDPARIVFRLLYTAATTPFASRGSRP